MRRTGFLMMLMESYLSPELEVNLSMVAGEASLGASTSSVVIWALHPNRLV
jgi:hypothetical protein